MMMQPVVTRTQRRFEQKQLILIVLLVIVVALASFVLGVVFGQRGGSLPGLAVAVEKPKLPMMTHSVAPPPRAFPDAPEKTDQPTFYDDLPKGNLAPLGAPLGSGINLPPEEPKPVSAGTEPAPATPPPAASPAAVPSLTAPAQSGPSPDLPVADKRGSFIVQIASFRSGEDAGKLVARLNSEQLVPFIESADLGEKGVWHRVLAGPYASFDEAERVALLLREQERLSALVKHR